MSFGSAAADDCYKTVPSSIVKENSKALGIQLAELRDPSANHVEEFLSERVGEKRLQQQECLSKFLHLNPPHKHPKPSSAHRLSRRLSTREKKKLKLHEIPTENQEYDNFLPLHDLWMEYMNDVLQLKTHSGNSRGMNLSQLNQKVMKADYHGSLLSVVRSKCPSYIGVKGILLQETQNTLRLIDTDNKIRTVPKSNSVFSFKINEYQFSLYGNHMKFKASERSARKFKEKPTIDIN